MLGGALESPPVGAEVEEFDAFAATHAQRAARFGVLVGRFGRYLSDATAATQLVAHIRACLGEGRPSSLIRLGDGEGNLMALRLGEYPALAEYSARGASKRHFGAPEVLVRAAPEVLPDFHEALRNADVIGLPGPFGMGMLLARPRHAVDVRPIYGMASVHAYLERFADDLDLVSTTGAPSTFNLQLLSHYADLVADRDVGLVSCHPELVDGLTRGMGARSVEFHAVPKQAKIVKGPRADTRHYPTRYRELVEELRGAAPGRLYFVGAGILAKVYCEAIRSAGGVAVDIGHTADIWAGVRSRIFTKPATIDKWRLV